jgi:hypothetical protein
MKLSKVAFAVAGLAIASGSAFAGQIDSSSATLAREVIVTNVQTIRAPSKSYQFGGNVSAATNEQRLQLQWTLTNGLKWSSGGDVLLSTTPVVLPATQTLLQMAATQGGLAALPAGSVVSVFTADSAATLVFNVTIPQAAANFFNEPKVTINANDFLPANPNNVGITNVLSVAGTVACVGPDTSSNIGFKHFTNHFGNGTVIGVNPPATQALFPDSEHFRVGSTNDGRILNFTENLTYAFTPALATSRTDAAALNQAFTVGSGPANFAGTPAPVLALSANVLRHYIGKVNLVLRSNGLDLNYSNTYGNADNAAGFAAADFEDGDDIGSLATGVIELKDLNYELTIPATWPAGTVVTAYNALGVAVAVTPASVAAQTVYSLSAITAAAAADLSGATYLVAQFPGTALIPQTGNISVKVSLRKDTVAGAPDRREQDNVCTGPLTGIGGGIKIDIRNYASFAKFPTGPKSVVRLINNSETQTADVFAQMIYADGSYGAWGLVTSLAPRASANFENKDLEAKMINAPAASNPFGARAVGYVANSAGAAVNGTAQPGVGDRVRFVSNTGSTLRVQSFMILGSTILDTSQAQGVDFENLGDRTPDSPSARDAQPISQDAINGLSKN